MKQNKYLLGVFLFSVLLSVAIASAITTVTPIAGGTTNGTYNFSVTTTFSPDNCTWTATEGTLGTNANASAAEKSYSILNDTTLITEVEDTSVNVSCMNATGSVESVTFLFNIDNTAPVCVSSLNVGDETVEYLSGVGINPAQTSTDTTDLTYLWTLWDSSGNSQDTSTSVSPSFEGDDFDEVARTFTLGLEVTDEAGKFTACTNLSIDVKGTDDEEVLGITIPAVITENKTSIIVAGGALLLIISTVVVIMFAIRMKKG